MPGGSKTSWRCADSPAMYYKLFFAFRTLKFWSSVIQMVDIIDAAQATRPRRKTQKGQNCEATYACSLLSLS